MNPFVHCLDPAELDRFLKPADPSIVVEVDLAAVLSDILQKANEFVPSDSGSILLAEPINRLLGPETHTLTFITAFGERSETLIGLSMEATEGIAGKVYRTGDSHRSGDAAKDVYFQPRIDAELDHQTRSLVAVPIRLADSVCGVLELLNHREAASYSGQDLDLLEMFANYISISVQNALDGRQAQELAKRDNLTDLYNDRYLHIALTASIQLARETSKDLALLFLDLDLFKRVNDSHGHLAGSQVLREVGQLLAESVPPEQGIAARYGGDEFVLALPEADLETAVDKAEEIRNRIESNVFCKTPGSIQPEALHLKGITCSVGVATLRRHLTNDIPLQEAKSALLHLADAAMYVSKETGRNRTALAGEVVRRRVVTDFDRAR